MSAVAAAAERRANPGAFLRAAVWPWLPAAGLLLGLGLLIAVRWAATRGGLDALLIGLAFGVALAVLAVAGRPWGSRGAVGLRSVAAALPATAVGVTFGLALVGLVAVGASLGASAGIPGLGRPAAPILPWAAITVLVASAEEALFRGRLFDVTRRAGGTGPALAITTIAFALMHVPLYGWGVVPLDLAVGLALGGLRLVTGRVAAPAAAHVVADVATWWL